MMMRVHLQPSYVLHTKPYRDTSLLVELFTAEHGRVGIVAKGARRKRRSGSQSALLQPFIPLLTSFSGRGELKTLLSLEHASAAFSLIGERLFSGLYLNELLIRLLPRQDAHPNLFAGYTQAMEALSGSEPIQPILRRFEWRLLEELGYGFSLSFEGSSGDPIDGQSDYYYEPTLGLITAGMLPIESARIANRQVYPGHLLLALERGTRNPETASLEKLLLRAALAVHLGERPLRSRDLFLARDFATPGVAPARPLPTTH